MPTRNTVQKRMISEQLHALGDHPTVDEVYEAVRELRPTISKATVYRVLRQMADSGDALCVPIVNGAERFDHRTDPHFHVVCEVCGHVEDVEESAFGGVDWDAVQGVNGYTVTGHELQLRGVCPACAAKTDAVGGEAEPADPSE